MRVISKIPFLLVTLVLLPGTVCYGQETGRSDQIQKPVAESIRIRQDTQEQEEQWRNDKQKLLAHYDQLEQEKKQLTEREQALDEKVNNVKIRIAAKTKQLDDIEQIQTEITPLIENLTKELEQFVASDLPFLPEERRGRMQRLEELRDDPEVTVSEKFRKVMEAMLIEAEYGNTIEVYQETIETGGRHTLVDIFRLGRLALFFQTLDQKECGFFNVAESAWQPLPTSYNRTISAAMEIGGKRRPVELLTLPLGRMQL
jgi:DNA repair exonuclease SbcCD ATPase subunit